MSSTSDPFSQARSFVWNKLTDKEKKELSGINTIDHVYQVTRDIQAQQANNKTMRNMNKIRPYIEGLQKYTEVIGIFVQAKPDILALIWGPIKFVLQAACSYLHGYDKLLDVFNDIGLSLPQFQQIEEIFRGNDQITNYLGLFYKEIVDFHFHVLKFFRATKWNRIFDAIWPQYEDIFTVIQQNIEKHKGLIDRQVNIVVIKEARNEREEALRRHQEERDFRELTRLEKNISHHTRAYAERLHDIEDKYCADTGNWIFTDPRFQSWINANASDSKQRLLWLAGIPGAGKTYLCFSILRHLQAKVEAVESACVVYAFPTYDDGNTKSAVMESILYQLCRANTALIPAANREYDTHASRSRISDPWDNLLEIFISRTDPVYMILDGLDECDETHRKKLLETTLKLCNDCPNLHVLVSSRKEVDIRQRLETNAEMVAVEEWNRSDIERYVTHEVCGLWERIKHIAKPEIENILMLENIKSQPIVPHILSEANSLPKNLHEIYGKMMSRISTLLSSPEQDEVKKIFSWLICARRPLKTIELEHALLIHPGDKELEFDRRLVKDIIELCGPIVEKRSDYLTFVHFSAKEFVHI
ncbi:hypothetical protein K440DRAFT_608109 [Wilcoxina mikolae CBS 423.85]|nr:hypothetical protein K440DRAFT_608109 [Wilcoxina mikolae CBS 423.85]